MKPVYVHILRIKGKMPEPCGECPFTDHGKAYWDRFCAGTKEPDITQAALLQSFIEMYRCIREGERWICHGTGGTETVGSRYCAAAPEPGVADECVYREME